MVYNYYQGKGASAAMSTECLPVNTPKTKKVTRTKRVEAFTLHYCG